MKILALHSDFIEFEAKKKALKAAEEIKVKQERVEECLVVLSSVEKGDEANPESVGEQYVQHIKDIATQVKTSTIVLYPYVHLSSTPSDPKTALKVLDYAEKELKKVGFEVHRSPFGWYKSFNVKCKGHPLSELSREFGPDAKAKGKKEVESDALKAEETMKSFWYILDLDGKLHRLELKDGQPSGFNFAKYPNLGKFTNYEMAKVRAVKQEPPHVKYMRELELVDYEPGSDPGNLRYYPKGRFIKGLIEDYVSKRMNEYGAMEIEAPIMYDFEHPSLKSYLHRFPARQYTIQTPNKKVFLRFAACFGQFLMAHDMNFSYKNLPMRLYEMTRYSFRVEQRGELTGLRRLRAFTMPDCHAFCKDIEQAKEEMKTRFDMSFDIHKKMGLSMPDDLEFAIRITKDFYEENKEFVQSLVKKWNKPALIEMWDKRFFYFVMKYEWNFVDALNKASALTTDQIDIENAERYGIKYTDSDGTKKTPVVMHLSPSGAVERVMYAFLERAYMNAQRGIKQVLPLWLAPTQVRVIPVSTKKHLDDALKFADELEKAGIRVDIDDNDDTIGKRIRNAEKEWIPFCAVVGDKEIEEGKPNVRLRESGEQKSMSIDELKKMILAQTEGMPKKGLPLNRLLSKRPIFVG